MFNNSIVTKSSPIYKLLIESKITLYLTTPQIHHLILFINSMVTKGYCGKITDVSDFMQVSIGPMLESFYLRALGMRILLKEP